MACAFLEEGGHKLMEQQWKGNSDVLLFHQSPYTEMQRSSV